MKEHTAIESATISDSDAAYYNLQGLRVSAANKAGIYITTPPKDLMVCLRRLFML